MQHRDMTIGRLSVSEVGDRLFAGVMLLLATAGVGLLPFRILARSAELGTANPQADPAKVQAAAEMAQVVKGMSRRIPWRTVCIHEALALHWILRSRAIPSLLHFGINPGDDRLSAHVWVSLGGKVLIGEEEASTHAQVAIFPGSN